MSVKINIYGFILFIGFSCLGQANEKKAIKSTDKKLLVSFFIEDTSVRINNHFRLYFVNEKDTFKVGVKGDRLILPNLEKDTGYRVVFLYGKYVLSFKGLTKKMIFPGQDVTWKFGIDDRPFNESLDILSSEGYKTIDKKVKQLQYLQFLLMEHGDGIQFVNKVE